MADGLDVPLTSVPLLSPQEESLLPAVVGVEVPAPPVAGRSLPAVVRATARSRPDSVAVVSRGLELTYRDLLGRADALAGRLGSAGVRRGDRVGLLLERSCDVVVAMLATMTLGAAYVPLEPTYPDERLRGLVDGSDLRLVLAHTHLRHRCGDRVPLLDLGDVHAASASLPAPAGTTGPALAAGTEDRAEPEDVAYVLFTSGTTGRPKGVEVEHRHLLAYLAGLSQVTGLEPGWSWAMVTTPGADLGLTNLFGALTTGGRVHLLTYEEVTDPDAAARYLAEHPVDAMKLVPSLLRSWCAHRDPATMLPSRLLVLAGEPCPWELVELVRSVAPDLTVHNHYGPTETTVSTMALAVPRDSRPGSGPVVPLGRPFPGTRAHILDAAGQPAPTGVPGELVIAGPSVSRGYLGRPDLTAERFVPEPRGGLGGRAYRSGDLVRRLPGGEVEFLGRVDDQVKIRGYRVEPGEIAAVAMLHPAVRDAVVVAREDTPGTLTLAAYLTGEGGPGSLDVAQVREHLRAHLPDHMVPVDLVPLDTLPLTTNGKVDRQALPAPDRSLRGGNGFEPPATPTERAVADSWSAVLGIDDVGATDSFFDLGGDSFSAVRAVRALDRHLSVVDLFTHPTVRALAAHLDAADPAAGRGSLLLRLDRGAPAARSHLVCVPYGGGSAVTFAPLAQHAEDGVAVYGVDLPGHDLGRREEELRPLDDVAADLADELVGLEGELVLYGHCLGGALAVRTALALEARGRAVLGVVAGGTFPSARLPGRLAQLVDRLVPSDRWLSDRAYHDMLRALGGFTDVVDPDDRAFLVRALRHDSREAEGYYTRRYSRAAEGTAEPRLAAPMLCVVGDRDRATELYQERFAEWEDFSDDVELAVIPGAGHYFLKHQAEELGAILRDRIHGWRAGLRPRSESAVAGASRPSTRVFLWVALTQLLSMLGTGLTSFALGIWVLQQTGSVTLFAFISVMAVTPGIFLSPVAGAVADRLDRRRVMIVADCVAGAATAGLVYLILSGDLQLWYIYVYACVGSAANAFQRPAYLAAVTQLVPKQFLGQANGLVTLGTSASDLLAALAGGVLVGLFGLAWVVAVDVVTFALAMVVLLVVRFPDRLWLRREEGFWSEVTAGFRYIARRRPLVVMAVFFVVFNLLFAAPSVLATSFVLATSSPQVVGMVLATGGLGALAGAVAMGLWGGTRRRAVGMVGGTITLGAGVVVCGLTAAPVVQSLGLFLVYGSLVALNAHWLSLIQTKVGMELQGRVLAVNQMLAMSTMPVGFVAIGPFAGWVDQQLETGRLPDLPGLLGLPEDAGHLGLALVVVGLVICAWGVVGLLTPSLRLMEDALPDTVPDAVLTWDRDELQRQADARLAEFAARTDARVAG